MKVKCTRYRPCCVPTAGIFGTRNAQIMSMRPELALCCDSRYNLGVTSIKTLPLFPLNTVLFPGQVLPLHIFEPRYRLMAEECLSSRLAFGVVLIREGQEVGGYATPFEVGTTARISQVERLPNGRLNIMCIGESRFKIVALQHDRPFLTGDVELWQWTPLASDSSDSRADKLARMLTRYLRTLAQATGNAVRLEGLPSDPESLASLAAIALQVPNPEKQRLLSTPQMSDLLDGCIDLLLRENRAFQITLSLPAGSNDQPVPFSSN